MRAGYDAIAERYAEWAATFESPELQWVEELLSHLQDESDVLDLGCGGGRIAARIVAERHRYTGVDLSPVQIERARERIPNGRFLVADVTRLELEPESLEALNSVRAAQRQEAFHRVASGVAPNHRAGALDPTAPA